MATRFRGYVVPVDNALYPIENVLHCRGRLYRAAWVRNTARGAPGWPTRRHRGARDEEQVQAVLTACGVPYSGRQHRGHREGPGLRRASTCEQLLAPSPFTWAEGQSGLDYIEQLDAVSVPDDASPGRYRTVESLGGDGLPHPPRHRPRHAPPTSPSPRGWTSWRPASPATPPAAPTGSPSPGPPPGNGNVMPGDPTDVSVASPPEARFTVASELRPLPAPRACPARARRATPWSTAPSPPP